MNKTVFAFLHLFFFLWLLFSWGSTEDL